MKPQLFTSALILLSAVLMLSRTDVQQIVMNNAAEKNITLLQDKKIADEPSVITGNRIAAKINFHARKDFTIKYKDVNNVIWYDIDGGSIARVSVWRCSYIRYLQKKR